jgi:hypothetical protein
MADDLQTIKVFRSTVQDLNLIAAMTGERQYEVVWRLAKTGRKKAEKITKPLSERQRIKKII